MAAQEDKASELLELELLERVFLRLGVAETDEQLEKTLGRFLGPVLLKSASPHKAVQEKVLDLLTHVNKRLRSRTSVQVPVEPLLVQFSDSQSPPQVVNFTLVYLRLGYPRLSPSEQGRLLPQLVATVEGRGSQQQDSLLQLLPTALVHLSLPRDLQERRDLLRPLWNTPTIKNALLDFLLNHLLLPYGPIDLKSIAPPPGLSFTLVSRVMGGNFLEPDLMEKVRLSILKLLSSEIFSAEEVFCHFIVAAGDSRHSVSDQGDRHLRQFASDVDWEHSQFINKLLLLYQGTVATPGKRTRPQSAPPSSPNPKDHRAPASLRLRLRIMPYLIKSTYAANYFPACMQVVFDSLFGTITNTKLRTLTLEFINHISSRATDQKLAVMAPVLLTGLTKITNQPSEDSKLQVLAYSAIGSIAKKVPSLFRKDTKYLRKLFEELNKDLEPDIGLAIQECLSFIAGAYRGVGPGQSALIVEALLLENIYSQNSQARLSAVHYATAVFPFSHVPSRFVCMIACGDSKEEVREEGKRGLRAPTEGESPKDKQWTELPGFNKMVQYFHKRASLNLQSGRGHTTAAGTLPFSPPVLAEGLKFMGACLCHSAGVTDEQKLTNRMIGPITAYLAKLSASTDSEDTKVLPNYLELLKQALTPAGSAELHSVAMVCLLEAVASSPPEVALTLSRDVQWIRGFTRSSRPETREPAGQLLGLLSRLLPEEEFLSLVEQILRDTWSESYHTQHGAVVSLGYVVGNCLRQQDTHYHDDTAMDTDSSERVDLVRRALKRLVVLLSAALTSQLVSSTCAAIGEIARSGPLPIPSDDGGEGGDGGGAEGNEGGSGKSEALSKRGIVACLAGKLKSAKEVKLKERCALSLGYLAIGDPQFPDKRSLLQGLFQVKEEKAVELQLTVGEAISCAAAGPLSTASHDPWRLPSNQEPSSLTVDPDIMSWTLETLLTEFAASPLATVRQTACVWLLALLKHAGNHPDVQNFLKQIQMVFMGLLAETNEVTQEVASRGMGLVYELSGPAHREELVGMLVGTLMEGRRLSHGVTEDTKLFPEGALGKTPKGGNLSTYKELCSLASDLNKPDLVYKFMHLANHHALWNSKKGAAFGFSSIASQAQAQLAPYLPSLVPRLYRYKYDPKPQIQLAMSNIWAAIIPESKKTVDRYLEPILQDLKTNLNSNLWRNREASCMALSDLLIARQVGEVASSLPELWELCLRARDDIKETVREAADVACKALHKVTVRACDSSTMDKTGAQVVKAVLPLLLQKGMTNPSSEIRVISLGAILKISKNAGPLLKPNIPLLVPTLLESLSVLEPQSLNTLSLRLTGETGVQEKLEDIRVAASRSSPMMETVNLCVPHTDGEVLSALVPKIVEILKTGVGFGTKVATAQFVVSLVHHSLQDLTPYAGKLLSAFLSGLTDRSSAVRKAYAKAIGHLIKVAKETSVSKMIEKLKTWYHEKDDPHLKVSTAHVFHAISLHSPDTAKAFGSDLLPLVFLAMHAKPREEDAHSEDTIKLWRETWQEVVPGTESGIRIYLAELVGITCPALSTQSWHIKAQAAAAIATIAEKIGSQLGPPHLATILTALLEALQGRTWEGKEALLGAVRTVCVSCKTALVSPQDPHQPSIEKITEALLQQCKKQTLPYKAIAIETTGEAVEVLEVDIFQELSEILLPLVDDTVADGSLDEEGEDRRASRDAKLDLQAKVFQALGQAWPSQTSTQGHCYSRVCRVLTTALPLNTWRLQLAILSALVNIFSRLKIEISQEEVHFLASKTIPATCKCLGTVKYSTVRHKALQTLDKQTSYLQGTGKLSSLADNTISLLKERLSSVADAQDKELAQAISKRLQDSLVQEN